jgi:hypothetical protein
VNTEKLHRKLYIGLCSHVTAEETLTLPHASRDSAWTDQLERRAVNVLSAFGIPITSYTEDLADSPSASTAASKLNQAPPHDFFRAVSAVEGRLIRKGIMMTSDHLRSTDQMEKWSIYRGF